MRSIITSVSIAAANARIPLIFCVDSNIPVKVIVENRGSSRSLVLWRRHGDDHHDAALEITLEALSTTTHVLLWDHAGLYLPTYLPSPFGAN